MHEIGKMKKKVAFYSSMQVGQRLLEKYQEKAKFSRSFPNYIKENGKF